MNVTFTVPGVPVGKARARVTRNGTFTPKKTRHYERDVKLLAKKAIGFEPPTDQPVHVDLVVILPIPKSWPKYRQAAARAGTVWPTKVPDLDNLEKSVTDGCNGVVYLDDAQICEVVKTKRYGSEPQVWVNVYSIGDEP